MSEKFPSGKIEKREQEPLPEDIKNATEVDDTFINTLYYDDFQKYRSHPDGAARFMQYVPIINTLPITATDGNLLKRLHQLTKRMRDPYLEFVNGRQVTLPPPTIIDADACNQVMEKVALTARKMYAEKFPEGVRDFDEPPELGDRFVDYLGLLYKFDYPFNSAERLTRLEQCARIILDSELPILESFRSSAADYFGNAIKQFHLPGSLADQELLKQANTKLRAHQSVVYDALAKEGK